MVRYGKPSNFPRRPRVEPPKVSRCDRSGVRYGRWAFVGVAMGLYLWMCRQFFGFTADDALIITRYADNLARGNGLVFNVGEQVGALTCPLIALLQAALVHLTGAPVIAYKSLSITLVVTVHVLCLWHLRRLDGTVWLYTALVLTSPYVALWTVGGMETPVLLFLVTTATLSYLRQTDTNTGRMHTTGFSLLAGLAFLARHDSAVFFGLLVLDLLIRRRQRAFWLIVPGALVAGGWLLFAQWYYHDLLPTSYHVKMAAWPWYEVKRNAAYLAQGVIVSGLAWIVLWTAARLVAGGTSSRHKVLRHLREHRGLYFALTGVAAYGLLTATKHMMFSYRMFVPYLPAAALALLPLLAMTRAEKPARRIVSQIVLGFTVVAMLVVQVMTIRQIDLFSINPGLVGEYPQLGRRHYARVFAPALRSAAEAAAEHWQADDRSADRPPTVYTFAGGMTYYLPDAHVYETLVSYRHDRPFEMAHVRDRVDYLFILAPEHGSVESQIGAKLLGRLEVVSRQTLEFDGRTNELLVLHNPSPGVYRLPPRVDGVVDLGVDDE
ncbi:MAG: hypothetical protein HQ581_07310 [Planctomycetes bacterium]|nr:hypothetical protein [Planctomycetota bacterium]